MIVNEASGNGMNKVFDPCSRLAESRARDEVSLNQMRSMIVNAP